MSMDKRYFLKALSALMASSSLSFNLNARQLSDVDFYFTRLSYESGDWEVDERMPANVLNSLIEYTSQAIATARVSGEGQEGLSAFFEKRAANWRNHV